MRRRTQVIGVVMTVNALQHFDAHAQKSRRFPPVDARTHQPGGRRVPQGVRRDPARGLGQPNSRLKRGLNSLNRSAARMVKITIEL